MASSGPHPLGVTAEVGAAAAGADQVGSGCLDLGDDLRGGGPVGSLLRVGYVSRDTMHW